MRSASARRRAVNAGVVPAAKRSRGSAPRRGEITMYSHVDRADILATAERLGARFRAAAKRMCSVSGRRDPAVPIPVDCDVPPLPRIPDLPAAYLTAWSIARSMSYVYQTRLWDPAAADADATAVHRDSIPHILRATATPAEIVASIDSLDAFVSGVERLAADYASQCEAAAARHALGQAASIERLAAYTAAARAERAAQDMARAEAKAQADKQARDVAAERAQWISSHGSPRLQRLAAESIEHGAVYRDERLAIERPGWVGGTAVSIFSLEEPRNPPMAALELLDRARTTAPDAVLRYYRQQDDDEAWYETGYVCTAEHCGRVIVTRERVATQRVDESDESSDE